jgi:hypothetical protein
MELRVMIKLRLFYDTYGTTGANYQGIIGLQPTRLYNADFGWETNQTRISFRNWFFKDRILAR